MRAMVRERVSGSHAGHLCGVVVEEDKGGARQLEARGEAAQAGRLGAPVHLVRARVGVRAGVAGWPARVGVRAGAALHLPRGELLARDCHLGGAQIEDLEHVGLVVLRGEAEQPAAPLQPSQRSLQREVALGLGLRLRLRLGLGLSAALGFSGLQREVVRLEGDAACPLLRHRAAPQRTVAVAHEHLERIAQLARHTPGQGWS